MPRPRFIASASRLPRENVLLSYFCLVMYSSAHVQALLKPQAVAAMMREVHRSLKILTL